MAFLRGLLREVIILLIFWVVGWALWTVGSRVLAQQKERYWSESIVSKKDFLVLSLKEREAAREQYMRSWAVGLFDEPMREGNGALRWAYGAQVSGAWLKENWLLLYVVIALARLLWIWRRFQSERSSQNKGTWLRVEIYALAWCFGSTALWYLVWAFLVPSLYAAWGRFVVHSYAYLWDARLQDFSRLAEGWFYVLFLYPLGAIIRLLGGLGIGGKSR